MTAMDLDLSDKGRTAGLNALPFFNHYMQENGDKMDNDRQAAPMIGKENRYKKAANAKANFRCLAGASPFSYMHISMDYQTSGNIPIGTISAHRTYFLHRMMYANSVSKVSVMCMDVSWMIGSS